MHDLHRDILEEFAAAQHLGNKRGFSKLKWGLHIVFDPEAEKTDRIARAPVPWNNYVKTSRLKRKASGKCINCGLPAALNANGDPQRRCILHKEKHNEQQRARKRL